MLYPFRGALICASCPRIVVAHGTLSTCGHSADPDRVKIYSCAEQRERSKCSDGLSDIKANDLWFYVRYSKFAKAIIIIH